MPGTALIDLFNSFYAPRKLGGATQNTHGKYRISINHFGKFLGHTPTTADLEDDLVTSFAHWLVKQGLAPDTANSYLAKIAALWDYLGRKRKAPDRPSITPVNAPRKKPVGWNHAQLRSLFKACSETSGVISGIPARYWWVALLSVLRETGERIDATLQLHWEDFDPETRLLTRPAENRKGKTEDKAFKLHADTVAILRKLRKYSTGECLFPLGCSICTVYNRYRRLLEGVGLPSDRQSKFHRMRRSVASYFEAAGGDATKLLGHSGRRVTEKSYLDPTITETKHASDLLFRPRSGPIRQS